MDNHIDTVYISVHIDVEHVNHAVSVDIREVEQVVDLLGHLLSRHEAERPQAFQRAGILMELLLRLCLRSAATSRGSRSLGDDSCRLVANLDAL